jgi:hypothetical protein
MTKQAQKAVSDNQTGSSGRSSRSRKIRTMPDGRETSNLGEYFKAWDAIRSPIERELGVVTVSYDPGLCVRNPDGGHTVDMPMWFAMKLAERLGG